MSRLRFPRAMLMACGVCSVLLAAALPVLARQYDPSNDAPQAYDAAQTPADSDQAPGRVARLAYLSGQVQFAPAGENDWGSVDINRPMVIGDRLLTGDDGLAALELGDASVRLDHDSAFDFLNLAQDNIQIELSQGTLNLAIRQLADGGSFEVDTPTLAFVATAPGVYRIDDDPDGNGSIVTVFQGAGTVYGENSASRQVVEGSSYRFNDSALASVEVDDLPQPDNFDRFCETRDANYARYTQQEQQYVPPDMIGGEDLYQYGQWDSVPEYGNVWYPTAVPAGWAPYRYGHWAWIGPWGWTWVDNQPWGFAPFHYGRWVHIRSRWGWMPGPVHVRPVYAPALVAFIGGSGLSLSVRIGGGPVGWFPLGPRDIYVPWFHASRRYFTRVNVTNIRNVYVNQTVINNIYNDYHHKRFSNIHRYNRYAYQRMPGAVTAVPHDVFAGARAVHPAVLRLNPGQLARTKPAFVPDVLPGKASLGLRHASGGPAVLHGRQPFVRPVIAHHTPPPLPIEFAAREKAIAGQHGQPLTTTQMHNLGKRRFSIEPRDARVKMAPAQTGATAGAATPRGMRRGAPLPRPAELPSARFAHPAQPSMLPRVPVILPADESRATVTTSKQLPVVRPLEGAPRSINSYTAQQAEARQRLQAQQRQRQIREQAPQPEQQHAAQLQVERQARDQQAQQQRTARLQAQQDAREQTTRQQTHSPQQRLNEQQAQQQRNIQVQAEQRARVQQMQQQRRVEMQSGQRTREQAVLRQREAQTWAAPRTRMQPVQRQQPMWQQPRQAQRETRQGLMPPREHYVPHPNNGHAQAHPASPQSGKHPKHEGGRP